MMAACCKFSCKFSCKDFPAGGNIERRIMRRYGRLAAPAALNHSRESLHKCGFWEGMEGQVGMEESTELLLQQKYGVCCIMGRML
jgi:hypothetical protein